MEAKIDNVNNRENYITYFFRIVIFPNRMAPPKEIKKAVRYTIGILITAE